MRSFRSLLVAFTVVCVLASFGAVSVIAQTDATPEASPVTTPVPPTPTPTPVPALPGAQVLTVVERSTTDTRTDLGDGGDSVGDINAFGNEVYDAQNTNLVGRDHGMCVRTVPGESWECLWTFVSADGTISVQGVFLDGGDSVLSIVGGTGVYDRATGLVRARKLEEGTYEYTYEIVPVNGG